MRLTSSVESGLTWLTLSSMSHLNPSMIPTTSHPPRILRIVTALMTLLIPGAGPPPTRMPTTARGEFMTWRLLWSILSFLHTPANRTNTATQSTGGGCAGVSLHLPDQVRPVQPVRRARRTPCTPDTDTPEGLVRFPRREAEKERRLKVISLLSRRVAPSRNTIMLAAHHPHSLHAVHPLHPSVHSLHLISMAIPSLRSLFRGQDRERIVPGFERQHPSSHI